MEANVKFKALRIDKGPSQLDFAEKLGVSRSLVADIERGKTGISKKLMSKIREKFDIESGYFDASKNDKAVNLIQGSESGANQDSHIYNEDLTGNQPKKANAFPPHYFDEQNRRLNQNIEKKLLVDIIENHKNINVLQSYLNTINNFEFIIDNLNYYYFNKVDLQFHSSPKYLVNGKFLYDQFKEDFIKEIEKLEVIRPALAKLSAAIELFYDEIKEFDKEGIISGYFGKSI